MDIAHNPTKLMNRGSSGLSVLSWDSPDQFAAGFVQAVDLEFEESGVAKAASGFLYGPSCTTAPWPP
jgi:hypothetical protein